MADADAAPAPGLDFKECLPCGGACCKVEWTVFVTPEDIDRLEAHTGRPAREFAALRPLPAWEREAFGEGNLLWPRAETARGEVPQLRKRDDGACAFLTEAGLCGVHAARPLMCRLFPFWYRADGGGRVVALTRDRGYPGPMGCPLPEAGVEATVAAGHRATVAVAEAFEAQLRRWEGAKGALAPALRARLADPGAAPP